MPPPDWGMGPIPRPLSASLSSFNAWIELSVGRSVSNRVSPEISGRKFLLGYFIVAKRADELEVISSLEGSRR